MGETLAFVGFPGEPFTAYGTTLKAKSPFTMTVPACIVNGNFGYLPTDEALREEGYETQGSLFVPGLEQAIVKPLKRINWPRGLLRGHGCTDIRVGNEFKGF